jgi:hypothetical protein
MKRSTVFSLIAAVCALFALIFSVNFLFVQRAASDVLSSDPRNYGIEVSAHYDYWIDTSNIVFDLTKVSGTSSEADVTRVLFRFAEKMKDRRFGRVYLSFQGHTKFFLDGEYFKELGDQVPSQNPIYLIRTLPENVRTLSGERAFGTWTGGILGVVGKQIEDFNQFHRDWYLNDMAVSATH